MWLNPYMLYKEDDKYMISSYNIDVEPLDTLIMIKKGVVIYNGPKSKEHMFIPFNKLSLISAYGPYLFNEYNLPPEILAKIIYNKSKYVKIEKTKKYLVQLARFLDSYNMYETFIEKPIEVEPFELDQKILGELIPHLNKIYGEIKKWKASYT